MWRMMGVAILTIGIGKEAAMAEMRLSSGSFLAGREIPAQYTCEGGDVSPPLSWTGAPAGTRSFALICDDPDAPTGTWVHWVIFNVPAGTKELPENVVKMETAAQPAGARQGENDFKRVGYGGPCPPRGHGVHHYHFKLYALLNLPPRSTKQQVEMMMRGHVLAAAELIGTYQRR